jgi:hypothetical protein
MKPLTPEQATISARVHACMEAYGITREAAEVMVMQAMARAKR